MLSGPVRGGDRGSLVLAMGILMVLTLLAMGLLARMFGALTLVRHTQDYSAALAVADAGLAEGFDAIRAAPDAAPTEAIGDAGGGSWTYQATRVDTHTWLVRSIGVVNRVRHTVEATIRREPRYPYAIFTVQDLTLEGQGGSNILTWRDGALEDTAAIGSNHAITVNGGGGGARQEYFTPAGSCSGCDNPVSRSGPRTPPPAEVPSSTQPCPPAGLFTGSVIGGVPYRCDIPVTFEGTVSIVNPPLEVYVIAGQSASLRDAEVNLDGPAADFRLLLVGSGGNVELGSGAHAAALHGIIYAPQADLTLNGGQQSVRGSIVVNKLRLDGNPNFTLEYDDSVRQLPSDLWSMTGWHEVSSG